MCIYIYIYIYIYIIYIHTYIVLETILHIWGLGVFCIRGKGLRALPLRTLRNEIRRDAGNGFRADSTSRCNDSSGWDDGVELSSIQNNGRLSQNNGL